MKIKELSGFPLVLSISEDEINEQLAKVYGEARDKNDMFPYVPWQLTDEETDDWQLNIDEFYAPNIDFNTMTENGCRLKMKVKKGNFTYYSMVKKNGKRMIEEKELNLAKCSFYITTPMHKIKHEEWSDEVFQVQSVFMDLTRVKKVEIVDLNNSIKVKIGSVLVGLAEIIKNKIEDIGRLNTKTFLFGSVKIPQIKEEFRTKGSLTPTSFTYSTHKQEENGHYQTGDLNFLLMLDNKDIPEGAVGKFSQSFILDDCGITLVIAGGTILEKFIVPSLVSNFGPDCNFTINYGNSESGMPASAKLVKHTAISAPKDIKTATLEKCNVTCKSGQVRADYEILFVVGHWAGDEKITATGNIVYEFKTVNGKVTQDITSSELEIENRDFDWWGRIFAGILTLGFNEWGRWSTMTDAFKSIDELNEQFDKEIGELFNVFILPGKAVIKYSGETEFEANTGLSFGATYYSNKHKLVEGKKKLIV